MKFRAKGATFGDDKSREKLAMFLQATIDADDAPEFKPFRTDEFSSSRWKIDQNNNWFLRFFDDEPDVFEIRYRYQNKTTDTEAALAGWLVYRLAAEIVGEPQQERAPA